MCECRVAVLGSPSLTAGPGDLSGRKATLGKGEEEEEGGEEEEGEEV